MAMGIGLRFASGLFRGRAMNDLVECGLLVISLVALAASVGAATGVWLVYSGLMEVDHD